jgi:hypothetical protein
MKRQNKLKEEQAQEQSLQEEQQTAREFGSVEDLLRHDAVHTPVPPAIAQRLQESIGPMLPPTNRPWWKRLFG